MLGVEIPIKNKWEFSCNSREAVEGRNGNSGVLFGGPRAAGASAGSDEVQQQVETGVSYLAINEAPIRPPNH
jgi:hypothetical protein